ncbi:MAG: DUF4157 domain-containing protein [Cyanobacteria bacterium P01_F01_bin.150]
MTYQRKKRSQEQQQLPVLQAQTSLLASSVLTGMETDYSSPGEISSDASSLGIHRQQANQAGYDFGNLPIFAGDTAPKTPQALQPKFEATVQRDQDESVNLVPTGAGRAMPGEMQDAFTEAGMHHAAKAQYHVDDKATKSVNALAYATGNKIVVQDKIQNNPAQLKKTLAHEGTHVEEQATMDIRPDVAGTPINASHEANAEANEERFAKGQPLAMDGRTSSSQNPGLQRKPTQQSGFNFGDIAIDTARRESRSNTTALTSVQPKQQSTENASSQKPVLQRIIDRSAKTQGLASLKENILGDIDSAASVFPTGCGMDVHMTALKDAVNSNALTREKVNEFINEANKIEKFASTKVKRAFKNNTYTSLLEKFSPYMDNKQRLENSADNHDYRSSCNEASTYAPDGKYANNYKITDDYGVVSLISTDGDKHGGHSIVCFEYLENGLPQTIKTDLLGGVHGDLVKFQVRKIQNSANLSRLTDGTHRLWERVPIANIKAGIAAAESMISEPMVGARNANNNTVTYEQDGDSQLFKGKSDRYQYDALGGRGIAGKKDLHNINCARYATKVLKKTGIVIKKGMFITPKGITSNNKATLNYE